jgi:hypothetical protein
MAIRQAADARGICFHVGSQAMTPHAYAQQRCAGPFFWDQKRGPPGEADGRKENRMVLARPSCPWVAPDKSSICGAVSLPIRVGARFFCTFSRRILVYRWWHTV